VAGFREITVRPNLTKHKLQTGHPVFGVISAAIDPMIPEILGHVGFDYYMLDGEHGAFSPVDAVNIVRACEVANITPLVRLGSKDPKLVLPYLDAGMLGIMMPGLETITEVETLVTAVKYPPLGKRGLGFGRAADYLLGSGAEQAAYVSAANQETLVLPQFEDAALLDILPQLVQVPGVDGFVFGPRDLSLNMGYPDGPQHPEVQAVLEEATRIIRRAGLVVGSTAVNREAAQTLIRKEILFILTSLPNLLKQSGQAFLPRGDIGKTARANPT